MNLNTPRISEGPLTERDLDARRAEWPRRTAAFAGLTYQGRYEEPDSELQRQAEQARTAGVAEEEPYDGRRVFVGLRNALAIEVVVAVVIVACIAAWSLVWPH